VSRLASVARISNEDLNVLQATVSRFALDPQITLQIGCWLYAAGCLALIVVGYRKVVECFGQPAPISAGDVDQVHPSTAAIGTE